MDPSLVNKIVFSLLLYTLVSLPVDATYADNLFYI